MELNYPNTNISQTTSPVPVQQHTVASVSQAIASTPAVLCDRIIGLPSGLKLALCVSGFLFFYRNYLNPGKSAVDHQIQILRHHENRVRGGLQNANVDKTKILAQQVEEEMGSTMLFLTGLVALWAKLQFVIHGQLLRTPMRIFLSARTLSSGVFKKGEQNTLVSLPALESAASFSEEEVSTTPKVEVKDDSATDWETKDVHQKTESNL